MEDKEALEWEELSSEPVVQDKWINLSRVKYRLPDGKEIESYYKYSRINFVVVIASDKLGRYICVRQFRAGINKSVLEFCAGGIEKSGAGEHRVTPEEGAVFEESLDAAKRELAEETGYASDEWDKIICIPAYPTLADNYAYIYRAKNCEKIFEQRLDDTEFLKVELISEKDLNDFIASGDFCQPIHIMGYLMDKNIR